MNITGKIHVYFMISFIVMAIGVAVMLYNISAGKGAFNYDVEFTGGTEMTVDIGQPFENEDIIDVVRESVGETTPQVQKIVGTNQVSIKTKSLESDERTAVMEGLKEKYGIEDGVFSVSDISASISDEMKSTAVMAVLAACVAILLYVTLRFRDIRTGSSAVLALVHDSILVILSYAVFRIPLNYSFIAVVLTILGFSINATIIIFDRIRENKKRLSRPTTSELVNVSVQQTFTRCIYTSLTVLIVTLCLYIFSVPAIKDFSLPIMVGIICGTYSSIFLSGSMYYLMTVGFKHAFSKKTV